jgi:hypothetical protein
MIISKTKTFNLNGTIGGPYTYVITIKLFGFIIYKSSVKEV